jgi:hypothetical protein
MAPTKGQLTPEQQQEADAAKAKQKRERIMQAVEAQLHLYLLHRRQQISEQPLGHMQEEDRVTQKPKGEMRFAVTRTSSFSCYVNYRWRPGKVKRRPEPDAHSKAFRYVFDEQAEEAAAARKLNT